MVEPSDEDRDPDLNPDELVAEDPIDEAFVAYLRARDAGGSESREDFIQKFPELENQLSDLLDAADLIEQLAGPTSVPMPADPSADTKHGVEPPASDLEPDATLPSNPSQHEEAGPELPFELGDYVLEEVLGRGGMGVVYRARQKNLDRPVAVKMIRSGMLAGSDEIKRFSAEAKAAAKLKHPNIVAVHHFGHDAGHYYFSMDFIKGSDLSKQVESGVDDLCRAARYVRDTARAIDYAHNRGLLHRDLKPANVLTDEDDQVHVTDFGLAKHVGAESSLTASGAAVGTPNYMSPEQAGGNQDQLGPESDVYSMGAILFALITGRPPFVTDSVMQTMMHVMHKPAPPLSAFVQAPPSLETIVEKCLDKEPENRFHSAGDLADELDRFLTGQPLLSRPRSTFQKSIDWLGAVPIFAALSGRRLIETSESHRRFQTTMVALVMALPALLAIVLFFARMYYDRIPSEPKIAGGPVGGHYHELAGGLSQRLSELTERDVFSITTDGSLDNLNRLVARDVHLALLQASAVRGDKVSVIAPLYYEAVHVLARIDSDIQSMEQIKGRRVAIGKGGSGSRLAARMLLDSYGLSEDDVQTVDASFSEACKDKTCQVAIVCVARGNPQIARALQENEFRLIALPDANKLSEEHPTFRPLEIKGTDYPKCKLGADRISTVGTTAFLATHPDAPDALVEATLRALYGGDRLVSDMISKEHAAEWPGLALHPAARKFYEQD